MKRWMIWPTLIFLVSCGTSCRQKRPAAESADIENNQAQVETIEEEKEEEAMQMETEAQTTPPEAVDEVQYEKIDYSAKAKEYTAVEDAVFLAQRNQERALLMAEQYYADFYVAEKGLLRLFVPDQALPKTKPRIEPATCWEYGALMSMQSQLAIMEESQIDRLHEVNENLEYYGYLKDGSLWGYVVKRGYSKLGAADPGLAYDDLEWLVINFLRSYEVTHKKEYLDKAEYLMNFVLTEAWFEPLGGLFWDTRHEARHSCSNNPAIKPLVDLYRHTGKEEYLTWAVRVFDFSLTLKNQEKNIYEDLVRAVQLEDGSYVEGTPGGGYYTYNTGTIISGGAALYGITGEERYLQEALLAAKGAYAHFAVRISDTVTYWPCTSNLWFNNILLRGYIDLYPYAKEEAEFYINTFQNSMDFAYETYLQNGYMPINWVKGWGTMERDKEWHLDSLDHTAQIEMYAMLANWQKNRE